MREKIAFLLGSPDISGGTYVIFQHAIYAMNNGYEVSIITDESIAASRLNWHSESKKLNWLTYDKIDDETEFDYVFATWWKTVFNLGKVKAKKYSYFVQSIESKFYPASMQNLRKLVDSTYLLPLNFITEATWIKEYLKFNHHQSCSLAFNGARKDIYKREGELISPKIENKLRVLVEGPLNVSFKNVEKTIELCKQSNADEVWLLTSTPNITSYSGVDRVFSKVAIQETAKIYRSCDVIVKLSYIEGMFGPPLEMFHCGGTCIVYDVTGHDEYIENNINGIVIKTDNEQDVVAAINDLKLNREKLNDLNQAAKVTAQNWPSWEQSSEHFYKEVFSNFKENSNQRNLIKSNSEFFMHWYGIFGDNGPSSIKGLIKSKFPKTFSVFKKIKSLV
jgi:glycosyltransferase involved in cell wall biosynthesis